MGEVWRAKHKTLAREAAVKLIRPEVLQSSTGRQESLLRRRFEREAQVTASLRSPHTVALYDFGQSKDGAFYYVMELLEGIDLQTLVDRFGPMDPARVAHILYQVSQSLEEAHRAGLVHRDIKPRNIMLCQARAGIRLRQGAGFRPGEDAAPGRPGAHAHDHGRRHHGHAGLPVARSRAGQSRHRRPGRPVQPGLHGLLPADRPPGVRCIHTPTRYAIAHVQKQPAPMSERSELPVPAGLEAIVMQLLEKDPANRIQTAQELARRLRALRGCAGWSPERAERWWETNLPELSKRPSRQERRSSSDATAAGRRTTA